jgi:type I restriction enzyme M protein
LDRKTIELQNSAGKITMQQTEAQFLRDLDKRLWTAADRLRSNLDAAVYKHVVLGLIFLKYVSDAFKARRVELEQQFRDPGHDYYLGGDEELMPDELEARDYYTEKNVFWVPALARWDFIQANAKVAVGTKLSVKNGKTSEYEFKGIGRRGNMHCSPILVKLVSQQSRVLRLA